MSDIEIKKESSNDNYSECELEYLDEDSETIECNSMSETEQAQENNTDNSKSTESKKLRARTTPAQFQKLIAFMRCNADFNTGKQLGTSDLVRRDNAWNVLTAALNDIGPPIRTSAQWRRAWTVFKSNKRRRQAAIEANGDSHGRTKRMRIDHFTLSGMLPSS